MVDDEMKAGPRAESDSKTNAKIAIPFLDEIKKDLQHIATTTASYTKIDEFERLYILAAARRTLSLIVAFQQSIECGNEQMAATIIRLNLDTVARFYALFWAEETQGMTAESFAKDVFQGRELRKMKLRNGKEKATDRWAWRLDRKRLREHLRRHTLFRFSYGESACAIPRKRISI